MQIHGAILSPFVRKVLVVTELKGLDYEQVMVLPGSDDEAFRRISPLGKIPALVDGDFHISDSSVICEYLEEKYPEHPVMPTSPEDRARSRWIEEFGDTRLVECTGVFFFERFVKPMTGAGECDEERLANLLAHDVPLRVGYVESIVPDDGYFFGDLGVADLAIANPIINGGYGGLELDVAQYPKTLAFVERVKAHPVVAARLEAEAQLMGGR